MCCRQEMRLGRQRGAAWQALPHCKAVKKSKQGDDMNTHIHILEGSLQLPLYLSCAHAKSEITTIGIYWEACVPDSGYIHFLSLLWQMTTILTALNNTNWLSYSFGGQKSKIKVLARLGRRMCLSFPASRGHLHSMAHDTFLHLQKTWLQNSTSLITSPFSDSESTCIPFMRTPVITVGSPR